MLLYGYIRNHLGGNHLDFKRIPVVLKRYDFKGKMKICREHSKELMSINGLILLVNGLAKHRRGI